MQLEKIGSKISNISFIKDKVNIIFDNNREMEILKETFTDFYLYKGKELSDEEILVIKERNEIVLIKQYALRLLSRKMYSRNEIINKLLEKKFSKKFVFICVSDLENNKYIDDEKLCAFLIEEYNNKLYGEEKIRYLICSRGIDEKYINQYDFDEHLELDKCKTLLHNYIAKKSNLSYSSLKINAWSFLLNRGFKQKIVSKAIHLVDQMVSKEEDKEKLLKLIEKYVIIHQVELSDENQKEKIKKRYLAKGYKINIINKCIEEIQWKN